AVEVLRAAQREHPQHFRLAANLGTAWQLQGDLDQAAAALQQAVRLAPGKFQRAEEYHLKLVRLRQRQPGDSQALDDLFGIRYTGDKASSCRGKYPRTSASSCRRTRSPWCSSWPCGCRRTGGCCGSWRSWPTPTATCARRRRCSTAASRSSA